TRHCGSAGSEKPWRKSATCKWTFNARSLLGRLGGFLLLVKRIGDHDPQDGHRHSKHIPAEFFSHKPTPQTLPGGIRISQGRSTRPKQFGWRTLTALAAGSYPVPYGVDFDRRPEAQAEVRDLRWRTGGDGDHVGLALHPLRGPRGQVRRPSPGRRGAGPAASEKTAGRRRLAACLLRPLRGPGGPDFHGKRGHLRVLPAALHPVCPAGTAPERA